MPLILLAIPVIIDETKAPIRPADVVEEVAAAAQSRVGIRMLGSEELFADTQADLLGEVRRCGANEACLADHIASVHADLGVVVLVNRVVEPALVAVRLVDTREKRMVASAIGPLGKGEASVLAAVRGRVGRLLQERGFVLHGYVRVAVTPADAEVELHGGALIEKGLFEVAPGHYTVRAVHEGFAAKEVGIDVAAGATVNLTVALAPPTPVATSDASLTDSPWFWVALGAVVAGGAAATFFALRRGGTDYCVGSDEACAR